MAGETRLQTDRLAAFGLQLALLDLFDEVTGQLGEPLAALTPFPARFQCCFSPFLIAPGFFARSTVCTHSATSSLI
eukprot:COSAG04_NODE_16287_length_504_cov_0.893827_1_plen_75_part_10